MSTSPAISPRALRWSEQLGDAAAGGGHRQCGQLVRPHPTLVPLCTRPAADVAGSDAAAHLMMGHRVADVANFTTSAHCFDALRKLPRKVPEPLPPFARLSPFHEQPPTMPQYDRRFLEPANRSWCRQPGNLGDPLLLPGDADGSERAGRAPWQGSGADDRTEIHQGLIEAAGGPPGKHCGGQLPERLLVPRLNQWLVIAGQPGQHPPRVRLDDWLGLIKGN